MKKIIEWNINQRTTMGKRIPKFVGDEIIAQNADLVILTEFYFCINAIEFLKETFIDNGYDYRSTQNNNTNEIVIAWKKEIEFIEVDDSAITQEENNVPNYLCVDLKINNEIVSIVGARIRIVDYLKRREEMQFILDKMKNINHKVIIAGDFNNLRRSASEKIWNIRVIDKMIKNSFIRYTPDGQSIYAEHSNKGIDYEFAEDHFFTNGLRIDLHPYDRNFVYRDRNIYIWEKDFQKYNAKNKTSINIEAGNPDHAILIGNFDVA